MLAAGGEVSLIARVEETKGIVNYLRGKGALAGAKITFFSLLLSPIAFAIAVAVDAPALLLPATIPFFVGLVQMLYAIIFGKKFVPPSGKPQLATPQTDQSRFTALNSADTAEMPPVKF